MLLQRVDWKGRSVSLELKVNRAGGAFFCGLITTKRRVGLYQIERDILLALHVALRPHEFAEVSTGQEGCIDATQTILRVGHSLSRVNRAKIFLLTRGGRCPIRI